MEFIKNELINSVLEKYFETFSKTLDTAEYVPAVYGRKIHKYIFKNMKRKFREVDRAYRKQRKEPVPHKQGVGLAPPRADRSGANGRVSTTPPVTA